MKHTLLQYIYICNVYTIMLITIKYYAGQNITFAYGVCITSRQSSNTHLSLQLSLHTPLGSLHNHQSCKTHRK